MIYTISMKKQIKKVSRGAIEAALINLIENSDYEEDQIIEKVATMFEINVGLVTDILSSLD